MNTYTKRDLLRVMPIPVTVGLAGCSASNSEGTDEPSETPTDVITTEAVSYPEGWSEESFTDIETLRRTHRSAIGSRSYTFTLETIASDGLYNQANEFVGRVDPQAEEAFLHRRTVYDRNSSEERRVRNMYRYIAGDSEYIKIEDTDRENGYERGDHSFEDEQYQVGDDVLDFVALFDYTQETVDREGEPAIIRYSADEPAKDALEGWGEEWNDAATSNAESELGVRSTGVLTGFDLNVGTVDETEYFVNMNGAMSQIGETTISEPEWLEEARSETSG